MPKAPASPRQDAGTKPGARIFRGRSMGSAMSLACPRAPASFAQPRTVQLVAAHELRDLAARLPEVHRAVHRSIREADEHSGARDAVASHRARLVLVARGRAPAAGVVAFSVLELAARYE